MGVLGLLDLVISLLGLVAALIVAVEAPRRKPR
jgi:hypothetical protein